MSRRIPTSLCIALLGSGLVSGCGALSTLDSFQDLRSRMTNHNHSSSENPAAAPVSGNAPLETSIPNRLQIPLRYKGTSVTVALASNDRQATFECRLWPARDFLPCSGKQSHSLSGLVHGRSYTLEVRARSGDQFDETPTRLSFLSDQIAGSDLLATTNGRFVTNSAADKEQLPAALAEIPKALPDTGVVDFGAAGVTAAGANDVAARRTMALGRRFGVVVPYDLQVASWGSTFTYNQTTLLVFDVSEQSFASNCAYSWEVLDRGSSRPICRATPTSANYARYYQVQRPGNHVEMVRRRGDETIEGWLFSASDASATEPRDNLSAPDYGCPQGAQAGDIPLTMAWRDYFQHGSGPVTMHWCSFQRDGAWWWTATAVIGVGNLIADVNVVGAGSASTLFVGYKGLADQGIMSWNEVQRRFEEKVSHSLMATAP